MSESSDRHSPVIDGTSRKDAASTMISGNCFERKGAGLWVTGASFESQPFACALEASCGVLLR